MDIANCAIQSFLNTYPLRKEERELHRVYIVPPQRRGRVDSDKPRAPMSWMQRLKQWVFAIDIETCLDCGDALRVVACIKEPLLIVKIIGHVQPRDEQEGRAARAPPGREKGVLKLV